MASKTAPDPDPLGTHRGTTHDLLSFGVGRGSPPSAPAERASFDRPRDVGACPITQQIDHALIAMRKTGRRALRVLDVGCEDGGWLIEAALHASMLGFVAIEGRGFDTAADVVDRARSTAAGIRDPRIGLSFEVADVGAALADEGDHGVDIVLCHYGALARLPIDRHEHAVAELGRVTGATLICLGGAQ